MNNKVMLLALLIPLQSYANGDSVYEWGQWAQGIKPAAGASQTITPPPAYKPDVSFRPNENSAFQRRTVAQIAASPVNVPASPTAFANTANISQPSPVTGPEGTGNTRTFR